MARPIKISLQTARRMALHAQLLRRKRGLPKSKEGVARIIEKLGYIQLDTIAVVKRAHHHTIWTRFPGYNGDMLHKLQADDRRVFEYWGHQASFLPMIDFRYYIPMKKSFFNPDKGWAKMMYEKCHKYVEPILERIREEGPLSSKDFEATSDHRRGPWWNWKPAKAALEILFWRGELMITERRKFQKIYDLTERVLPGKVDTSEPTGDELGRFLVRRALNSYAVARENEIRQHIQIGDREMITGALKKMLEAGEIKKIDIEGNEADFFALSENLESLSKHRRSKPQIMILSPFDNMIIQRDRLKWLFDFEYALECFLPAAKRTYGYFVHPILYGEQIIGRVDPKAERKSRTLIINNIYLETIPSDADRCFDSLAENLSQMAQFNKCEKIQIKKSTPAKFKKELQKRINSLSSV
jgi:uncharacterized protein YcaQ